MPVLIAEVLIPCRASKSDGGGRPLDGAGMSGVRLLSPGMTVLLVWLGLLPRPPRAHADELCCY